MVSSLLYFIKAGLLGGAVAALINLIIFYVSRSFGLEYIVLQGSRGMAPIVPGAVIAFSLVPGGIAALLFWLLMKMWPTHARRVFIGISLIVLVASFALPIRSAEHVSEQTLLNIMHVIAAGCILFSLLRITPIASPNTP